MSETSEERFQRVAESRTNAILDKLRLLGQCSNNRNYSYSSDQVEKVFKAIETELKATKRLFNTTKSEKKEFRLEG